VLAGSFTVESVSQILQIYVVRDTVDVGRAVQTVQTV
jgi:hypothetical protein